jgi:hypothetical protein
MDLQLCPNPVFVIGSPRSGTTILATSLGKHSQLWTSEESEILFNLFGDGRLFAAYRKVTLRPKPSWLKANNVDYPEFLRYVGAGFNALFTSRSQGKRWVEQTPQYALMSEALAGMFPGAQFIHILRDARRVVHSMINVTRRYDKEYFEAMKRTGRLPPWPEDFRSACVAWRCCVEKSLAFCMDHPTRCITVLHEQLFAEPRTQFHRVLEFLGLNHEDAPSDCFANTRINSSFYPDFSKPKVDELNAEPWKEWTPEQKLTFLGELAATLVKHGLTEATGLGAANHDELVQQIAILTRALVPKGSKALVISNGENKLIDIQERTACHFPRDRNGHFASDNPANSAEAIEQLESLRTEGADYLVIPQFSMWWLETYPGFRDHLSTRYRVVWRGVACAIYHLRAKGVLTTPAS